MKNNEIKSLLLLIGLIIFCLLFLSGCVEEHHHHYPEEVIENHTENKTEKEVEEIKKVPVYPDLTDNEIVLDIKDIMRNCGENHEHYPEWAMEERGDGTNFFNYNTIKDSDTCVEIMNMYFNCVADTVISKYGREVTATGTTIMLNNGDVETIKPNQVIVGEEKNNLVSNCIVDGAVDNGTKTLSYDGGYTEIMVGSDMYPFELTID